MVVGRHVLPGTAIGTVSRKIFDTEGNTHWVGFAGLVVPGLRQHRMSTLLLHSKLEHQASESVDTQ